MLDVIEVFVGFLGAVGFLALGLGVLTLARRKGGKGSGDDLIQLEMKKLNESWKERTNGLREHLLTKEEKKEHAKQEKKREKEEEKKSKQNSSKDSEPKPRTFVLSFTGDLQASEVESFRVAISALLPLLNKEHDEVLLRLESPGGVVHGYGLAAAQVMRLKKAVRKLTICVDKVAASGGYMMACLGHKIVASPFAVVGSIGVLAGVPNLHRFIKDKKVDYLEMTAGKHKRTLTMLGEVTDEKKEKFQSQLEEVHDMFKDHVKSERPSLDLELVGTGEHWHAKRALELGLVDELSTSDEVIFTAMQHGDVFELTAKEKESMKEKLAGRILSLAGLKSWVPRRLQEAQGSGLLPSYLAKWPGES